MEQEIFVIRTEKKYEITRIQKVTLMNQLCHFMKMDRNRTEGYQVRSLYFDSIYDGDYFDKIEGMEMRKKIRIRIYSGDSENVKLELKKKVGDSQQKKTVLIKRELAKELISGRFQGLLEINSTIAEEIYNIMETGVYRPKCIIEYKRIAFWEEVNNIRVTFDSNIKVNHDYDNFFDKELMWIPVKNEPVMEVKYNNFLLSDIKHIIDRTDAQQISVSKYVLARQVLWI